MGVLAENRKARHEYEILETIEAGIELLGLEVAAAKRGMMSIAGSRVVIKNNEAFLVGSVIAPYQPQNTPPDYDSQRTRKLLLRKEEIARLIGKQKETGLTLIPLSVYTKHRMIKCAVALARGKKKYDKRETIKKRETQRRMDRLLKTRG
ncbi:MAG: SsrA-binding protein SmpB [Patescibacteria group bacterium]|jgi:SsrA-binding protein